MITPGGGGGTSSESKRPDWLQLPHDLLHDILRCFTKLKDFLTFQAVCKPWRQAAATFAQGSDQPPGKFRQSLPWLMQRCDDSNDSHGPNCCRFIDAAAAAAENNNNNNNNNNNIVAIRHMNVAGDDPLGYAHMGSSFGWLLRAKKQQHHDSLFLFNPFTGNRIPLPAITSELGTHHVIGFAMSAEPTTTKPEACMVMVHYVIMETNDFRWGVAFGKIGDQRWRFSLPVRMIVDIVFWKGKFYGIFADGDILICDASGVSWISRLRIDVILSSSARVWFHEKYFAEYYLLVSPDGELVMVVRSCTSRLQAYMVFKINVDCKTMDEIVSIGDYALFLDSDKAIYVSVKDHTECKRNCIYHSEGVFDLNTPRDNSISYFTDDDRSDFSGVWILPSNY